MRIWLKPSEKPEGAYCRTDAGIDTPDSLLPWASVDALSSASCALLKFFTWITPTLTFGLGSDTEVLFIY